MLVVLDPQFWAAVAPMFESKHLVAGQFARNEKASVSYGSRVDETMAELLRTRIAGGESEQNSSHFS